MGILDQIVADKKIEVVQCRERTPVKELERRSEFSRPVISLRERLRAPGSSGVIAEIKRKSPSRGELNMNISVPELSQQYHKAGAAALSILTDEKYFAGTAQDVIAARPLNSCPILRKEFIIDEYQLVEAKAIGADVILLIARILSATKLKRLADFAVSLGLEVLCEIHSQDELERSLIESVTHLGINSRNLDTLEIDARAFEELGAMIPPSKLKIAESGISDPKVVCALRALGFSGFLIGENFMKTVDPAGACKKFIEETWSR